MSIGARDDVVVRLSVGTGQEMLTPSDLLSLFYAYLNSMYFRFIFSFSFSFSLIFYDCVRPDVDDLERGSGRHEFRVSGEVGDVAVARHALLCCARLEDGHRDRQDRVGVLSRELEGLKA